PESEGVRAGSAALEETCFYFHPDTALEQVHVHHERGPPAAAVAHQALEPGERSGHDPDAVADADPRHGACALGLGHQAAHALDLLVGHGLERVPALAEDPHHAVRAGHGHPARARRREAQEHVAREERLGEHHALVAAAARHAHGRQEDLEALATKLIADARLVLV